MPTPGTEQESPGLGASAKGVAEHASTLVHLELELAALELKRKVSALGIGIGLAAGAALFLVFGLAFALATIAAGLATALPWWASLLIVTAGVFVLVAILGLLASMFFKRGTPPVPEQAITEAKLTTEALKHNGRN